MTFANNLLEIKTDTLTITWTALDALKKVDDSDERIVKVAMSAEWLKARESSSHLHNVVHNFDWTFSPFDFKGQTNIPWQATTDKINYEKLKQKEPILFYDEVILYEDELDDNGCSKLSVKIVITPRNYSLLMHT